jgi:peptide/nickel transport system ATP-binding protein
MGEKLLEIKNLAVSYHSDGVVFHAVNGIDLDMDHGKILGLVGETGAGKTTTALSIMNLLPERPSRIESGEIIFEGNDLLKYNDADMGLVRGAQIAMIFQDPMSSLNPVINVGDQIGEALRLHNSENLSREQLERKVEQLLELVGIPAERKVEYPHQFSGGMKQRVVIAIALACDPKLLIADEPTTALDVTIQAQVIAMMKKLRDDRGMSMIMITHDLGIVAETCDEVAVMYAGRIVEKGTLREVFNGTLHPYTEGLFNSLPDLDDRTHEPQPIKGLIPDPTSPYSDCCAFADRCPYAIDPCRAALPEEQWKSDTHMVACCRYDEPEFHIERGYKA